MWKSDETVLNYFQPFWQSTQQNTLYESIHLLTKCLDLFGYLNFSVMHELMSLTFFNQELFCISYNQKNSIID